MTKIRTILSIALIAGGSLVFGPIAASSQDVGVVQSQVLVIDPERLFNQTRLGQSYLALIQVERDALIARNRQIEAELEAEEKALTEKREETSPEEFREMADAFDTRVQDIRRDSERRVRDLERNRERAPVEFMRQVEPVLVDIMRAAGGVVVVDARNVLLRADVIDITDVAIARIDNVLAPGVPETGTDAPDGEAQGGTE
ncbi:OmpH family outer membrane protein [Roseovarius phycicola]|uniref:OmpH family outer membrane protein n=1 Tax=Roseovarius phycicola TaxID=3080976 RepID=A0ABZ2HFN2_9RHOB